MTESAAEMIACCDELMEMGWTMEFSESLTPKGFVRTQSDGSRCVIAPSIWRGVWVLRSTDDVVHLHSPKEAAEWWQAHQKNGVMPGYLYGHI